MLKPCFYQLQVFAWMIRPATLDVAQVCLAAWKSAACVRISFIRLLEYLAQLSHAGSTQPVETSLNFLF